VCPYAKRLFAERQFTERRFAVCSDTGKAVAQDIGALGPSRQNDVIFLDPKRRNEKGN
jgi:hypothetical protein